MDNAWIALLAAFVGSLLGALFAIIGNVYEQRRLQRERARQAVNGLIVDMHQRRAFTEDDPERTRLDDPRVRRDIKYATRSVIACRDEARSVRSTTSGETFEIMVKVVAILNACIESIERDPSAYRFSLQAARTALDLQVEKLAQYDSKIKSRPVGAKAFDAEPTVD